MTAMPNLGPDPASRNNHVLEAPRLSIRPPEHTDASDLYRLASGPDREVVTAGLLWEGPDSVDDVRPWVDRHRHEPYSAVGFGWVITDRRGDVSGPPGAVLGTIALRPHYFPGRGTVGYWLGKDYWRRGVMSEALGG